jgi:DNA-binding beta-propeller fold protein YncE
VSDSRRADLRWKYRRRRAVAAALLVATAAAIAFAIARERDDPREAPAHGALGAAAGPAAGHRGRSAGAHAARLHTHATRSYRYLRRGSNPAVLPGPVLIADRDNNRLLEVSPQGRVLWRFPARGDLARGQTFLLPDDAFYSPDGREVVATQEDDSVISVIDRASAHIVYRYGHPGVPGSEAGYVHNPDDAMLTPSGDLVSADIMNCRILVIRPPAHAPLHQFGETGLCEHDLGLSYGSPNGAFPMANGGTVVTEINGDWVDALSHRGKALYATHPPGFSYPSDTNQVRPGVFLSVDYTEPGAIETFTSAGRLRWRFEPHREALNHPSLAMPLPNGDILANDDRNDRVIVVDPHTNKIVWQYGHTGVPGTGKGFLSNPDGVDLAPPYSLTHRFAATMSAP